MELLQQNRKYQISGREVKNLNVHFIYARRERISYNEAKI